MFAEYLSNSPWANRPHRGWTILASFAVQALAVGSLLLVPLLYTAGLPQVQLIGALVLPTPPPAPLPAAPARTANTTASNVTSDGRIITPPRIPDEVARISEATAPAPVDAAGLGVRDATGDATGRGGVWGSLGNGLTAVAPPSVPAVAHQTRVSVMMEGHLIHRVQPDYPTTAKIAHVQGTVVLRAIISKAGTIENVQVISGPALLVQTAKNAVSQWRYRPYLLNDEPVEVETQVTVNFVLSGG
jgi:protein TonB